MAKCWSIQHPVHVRKYTRVRYGALEFVCEHYRAYPSR